MNTTHCSTVTDLFHTQCPLTKWFPSEEASTKIKNVAIGVIVGLGTFLAISALFYVLETHVSWFSVSQDAIKVFNVFQNVHPLVHVVWKSVWRVYVVLAGPIIEELTFRGWLNDKVEGCQGENQTTWKKVMRVVLVALIFGAMHLSPFQNTVSNFAIFGATAVIGFVFGILKETRKDLTSSITAHIIFNLAGTL